MVMTESTFEIETFGIRQASVLSGVPSETIRIWERRYALLNPSRTAGGHRQYNRDEVKLLRALRVLTERGHRIGLLANSDAADLMQQAEEFMGDDVAVDAPDQAPPCEQVPPDPRSEFIDAVIRAGHAFDFGTIERLFDQALDENEPLVVARERFLPLLSEAGRRWLNQTLPVEVEHLIGHLVFERLHAIRAARPAPKDAPKAVCACLPGDLHEFGLLTATLTLDEIGTQVSYLGSNVPLHVVARVLEDEAPKLTVLSATLVPSARVLEQLQEASEQGAFDGTTVVCGGAGASSVAVALGESVQLAKADEFEALAKSILF